MLAPPGNLRQTEIAAPAKRSFRATGNFPRRTPVRNLHMAYKLLYIYDYAGNKQKSYKITKMQMFETLNKASPDTGKYKRLKLGGGQAYDRSSD
jgi:hypothetical protein